jgi:two-component system KDP operon response regulator KdpE
MAQAHAAGRASNQRTIRVLLVVADLALANTVDLTLRHGSYACRIVPTVNDGAGGIIEWRPHLLVVDIDMEGGQGVRLIDEGRAGGRPMGIIALTRRSDLRGKLNAFERGADDYVGIPFVPDDLFARAQAVTRRTLGDGGELVPRLRIGEIEIDLLNRRVLAGEHELHLTTLEQALLYLLAANAGTVLSREQILAAVWGTDAVIESNVVDRHVHALRTKLQNSWQEPRYIETVQGAGYRFMPVVAAEHSSSV